MMEENQVYQMDAIEFLSQIDDRIVDMILCDLPYGMTNCEWDKVLPLDELWNQYKRILKEDGVVVLTASQPFTTDLINSNREWFRYELIWDKIRASQFVNCNIMPLKSHENILVFYKKCGRYYPQKTYVGIQDKRKTFNKCSSKNNFIPMDTQARKDDGYRFPLSVIRQRHLFNINPLHPTEKPINLFRYLIKTYTQEGELVVDNCVGSGTTAVACKQANRKYLCCDINPDYVRITIERLNQKTVSDFNPLNEESLISVKGEFQK